MNKAFFKKCLSILDIIEIHAITYDNLESVLLHELNNEFEHQAIKQVCTYLNDFAFLKDTTRGIDLSACATVFAKADSGSKAEALAFFECLYRNEKYRSALRQCVEHKITKEWLLKQLDPISFSLLTQTSLFLSAQDYYIIDNEYRNNIFTIIGEYSSNNMFLISTCLCAFYTKQILEAHKNTLDYKNEEQTMVDYPKAEIIYQILPRMGVPIEREAVKGLQIFYKDTLFHECNHACVLCHMDLAQLLIASHIKPFRECAHIYEAADYHNGLLLCRNHDFLFDQGYISFDHKGELLISKSLQPLLEKQPKAYQLKPGMKLPACLLSTERMLFLAYHRTHIFLDRNAD